MDRVRTNPVHIATSCSLKIHFNIILPMGQFLQVPQFSSPLCLLHNFDFILFHFTDQPYANGTNEVPYSVHIQQINRNSVHNDNKLAGGQFRFHSMEAPPTDENHDIFLVNEHFVQGCPICHDQSYA
jgi:hypothetical protein